MMWCDGKLRLVPDLPLYERRLGQQPARPAPVLTVHAGGKTGYVDLDIPVDGAHRAIAMAMASQAEDSR